VNCGVTPVFFKKTNVRRALSASIGWLAHHALLCHQKHSSAQASSLSLSLPNRRRGSLSVDRDASQGGGNQGRGREQNLLSYPATAPRGIRSLLSSPSLSPPHEEEGSRGGRGRRCLTGELPAPFTHGIASSILLSARPPWLHALGRGARRLDAWHGRIWDRRRLRDGVSHG
jgi:hypothetical protein